MKKLFEILVPTKYGDTKKPISTKHHKNWDKYVQKISGGLTLMPVGKGKWNFNDEEYHERIIPVRVMCDEKHIDGIINFTLNHYRQISVMYYVVSTDVKLIYNPNFK